MARSRAASPYDLKVTDTVGNIRKFEELECEIIRMAISRYNGHMSEVARRLGIDPATFAATLKQRNAELAAAGSKDCFGVEQGPFYAMGPVSCFVKGTDAGLAVNGKLQVLDGEGNPVENLYGAGLLAQGGMLLEGHGHHIGWAFTSGRLAGRAAAYLANTADADAKKER